MLVIQPFVLDREKGHAAVGAQHLRMRIRHEGLRRLMSDFKNECYELASKHVLCIESVLSDSEREGFHIGQLLHYRLEPNSSDETDAPPEKLTLAFATADAVILGWKLSTLAKHLRDGDLLSVRALPTSYANLHKSKCAVAAIAVEPVKAMAEVQIQTIMLALHQALAQLAHQSLDGHPISKRPTLQVQLQKTEPK